MTILGILSNILIEEYRSRHFPIPEGGILKRGPTGKDIVGLSWLAPEIKRHENCSDYMIAQWWKQCKAQAVNGAIPVLFWRPNFDDWHVKMFARIPLVNGGAIRCPVDITFEDFLLWFKHEVKARLDAL